MVQPKPNTSIPDSRKSIHANKTSTKKPENAENFRCEKCLELYLVIGEIQTVIPQNEVEKLESLQQNKPSLYPDLSKEQPFVCLSCEDQREDLPKSTSTLPSSTWIFLSGIVVLLISVFWLKLKPQEPKSFDVNIEKLSAWDKFLENQIYSMENVYRNQEKDVWYTLVAGIKYVLRENPNQPSVFMFIYDNESAGKTAKCLAKDVSGLAIRYLMHKEKEPLMRTGADFNTKRLLEDSGRLLVDLNDTVRDRGAMIVTELQNFPPEVAKSLHFFCDSYTPLVEKAVYFFTLEVDYVPKNKLSQMAGNKLITLWTGKIKESSISALITRMTPNVIGIRSDITNC